jgi:hypothetical protein
MVSKGSPYCSEPLLFAQFGPSSYELSATLFADGKIIHASGRARAHGRYVEQKCSRSVSELALRATRQAVLP